MVFKQNLNQLTMIEPVFIILSMSNTFYSPVCSESVSKVLSEHPSGSLCFELLRFIALRGECRLTHICHSLSCEPTRIDGVLNDLTRDMLIMKNGSFGDHLYSINPDMFLNVLEEMSKSARECILDSDNILLHSSDRQM